MYFNSDESALDLNYKLETQTVTTIYDVSVFEVVFFTLLPFLFQNVKSFWQSCECVDKKEKKE